MSHQINKIKTSELIPHPRNNDFFEDITGAKWDEFIESIKERGIIEPLIISQNNTVVSGHQRLRAAKHLKLTKVPCIVKNYSSDDDLLKDLIETNIRQRGSIGGSVTQIGNRIKELERLYGVFKGNNQHGGTENFPILKTQDQLAEESGMSSKTWRNYKQLSEAIPELKELLDTNKVTKQTALAIMNQLTPEEQTTLISSLDTTKKITKKQVDSLIQKQKELQEQLNSQSQQLLALQHDQENITQLITQYPELQSLIDTGQVTPGILKQLYDSSSQEHIQAFLKAINPQSHLLKTIEEKDKDIKRFKTGYEAYVTKTSELCQERAELHKENDKLKQANADFLMESVMLNDKIRQLENRPPLDSEETKKLFASLNEEKYNDYIATISSITEKLATINPDTFNPNTTTKTKSDLYEALTTLQSQLNNFLPILKEELNNN